MFGAILVLLFAFSIPAAVIVRRHRTESRREHLRRQPFPEEWRRVLDHSIPLYRHLPTPLKEQLHGHINVFLAEKNFEGGGGLTMTDEIRVTIAAQACILLLNRRTDYYPRLYSIIVYPEEFTVERPLYFSGHHHLEGEETRLGESWPTGAVVIAWSHARQGSSDPNDGRNVVFHEFAHQLDQEDGRADGMPVLQRTSSYITWARVLGRQYEDLQLRVKSGMASLLDKYGATNAAEFFAVATECFFERPRQMEAQLPDLYRELKDFYNQDPARYDA